MTTTTIETRPVTLTCPACNHAVRDYPIPIGAVVMCVCGKCGVRFEFAEALYSARLHDQQAVLDYWRGRPKAGYHSAASHVDASEFRKRQRARLGGGA